jgi:hypothetical protein
MVEVRGEEVSQLSIAGNILRSDISHPQQPSLKSRLQCVSELDAHLFPVQAVVA